MTADHYVLNMVPKFAIKIQSKGCIINALLLWQLQARAVIVHGNTKNSVPDAQLQTLHKPHFIFGPLHRCTQ